MVDVSDPLPPSPPDLEDRYVTMHNDDWDVYRNASGRIYYHNPVTGKSRWKPPRKHSVNAATIPRTVNSVRAFGSEFPAQSKAAARRYLTVRRDSPRFSDFETPEGYKEVYDDDSGLISYVDQSSGAQWFTNQDSDANVYFYTRINGEVRSAWRLPDVLKSRQDVMHVVNFSLITQDDAPGSDSCQQLSKAFANPELGKLHIDDCGLLLVTSASGSDLSVRLFQPNELPCHSHRHSVSGDVLASLVLSLKRCWVCGFEWHLVRLGGRSVQLVSKHVDGQCTVALEFVNDGEADVCLGKIQKVSSAFPTLDFERTSSDLSPPSPAKSLISSPPRFKRVEKLFAESLNGGISRSLQNKESKERLPHRRREGSEPPVRSEQREGPAGSTKLQRNGLLTRSFRIMAETVQLRPKNVDTLSVTARLERTPSKRIQILSRLMERRAKDKEKLIKQGILKHEAVFGNHLEELPKHVDEKNPMALENGLPDFIVRCVRKIETAINLPGLYRTNGNSSEVQKIRCDVDNHEYKSFDDCTDIATLTSTLKLFFRELPDPLIPKECRDKLCSVARGSDRATAVKTIKDALDQMLPLDVQILHYLLLHLKRVAEHPGNLMSSNALSIVVTPNLVHGVADARRPESLMWEIEVNNAMVERLIEYARDIFE